ncbi:hypothetical protein [Dankookia sp. P2]|uniref:hypothetical protein n=1 Tax=Dankookia sp. P2 TaxID=3423955 RepID=UPI003D6757F0
MRPDGLRLPVRVSSAPLPGEPGRVVVLVQDISEQREAELRRDLLMRRWTTGRRTCSRLPGRCCG